MSDPTIFSLTPVGFIRSSLKHRVDAPRQGSEGAQDAMLEVVPHAVEGIHGLAVGQDIILVTWLHQARRNVLKAHPRNDENLPLTVVFATRSPDRPNPLGVHRVRVLEIAGNKLNVGPIEAIDGIFVSGINVELRGSGTCQTEARSTCHPPQPDHVSADCQKKRT